MPTPSTAPAPMEINPAALRVIRERSGMSGATLARAAGISQPQLSNIETGKRRATPAVIVALARALAVELPAILRNPS